MGIPDHLTCLLRNLYIGQEATESDMEQQTGSKLGKEYNKAFNLYAEYIIQNARLDEAQAGIKISRRNINNLRYKENTHPYGRKRRGTKEPFDENEREE